MERLRMDQVLDVVHRLRKGQSERGIADDTGHSRVTVRRWRERASALGLLDTTKPLPSPEALATMVGPPPAPPRVASSVEPYASEVKELLDRGVEMVAIHRHLVEAHGYAGSYSSVRRFVRTVRSVEPDAFVRVETGPGEEAQVDFGSAGSMLDPASQKRRPAWCFVMTLSYSRRQYVEFVFDQTIPTWIGCHQRAFEHFGGIPHAIVVDNLKSAVIRHDLEDPQLSAPYRRMALEYGFLVHPCRPRTPRHKGKVENGVRFVKRNFLSVCQARDIADANEKALRWVAEYADVRTHGTTKQTPTERFLDERDRLLPVPASRFCLQVVRRARVAPDCHITLGGSYYSAPYRYVGSYLEVHVYESTVQLFDGTALVCTHPRAAQPGQRMTHADHYPPGKAMYVERTPDVCRQIAAGIGPSCSEVVCRLLSERPSDNLRAVQSLLSLAEKVGPIRMEAACRRALHFGDPKYRRIKGILAAGIENEDTGQAAAAPTPAPAYRFARAAHEFFPTSEAGAKP